MNSLRQCVTCKDTKDSATYLLPCLHPTCSQCVEEIVQEANQKKRKRPSCCDCGETFVQEKLLTVPSSDSSTSQCVECGAIATHFCRDCNEHLCKSHGEPHSTTRRTKGHNVQLVAHEQCCSKHSTEAAVGFCTNCKLLLCANCTLTEHNKPPHLNVTIQEAVQTTSDSVKKDIAKLLESLPAIDKEIKKHSDTLSKLEKERADLEAKIAEIRKEEKATTLQIEDLVKTKELLLTTQTQANALASTANTLQHGTLIQLQTTIAARVSQLQSGLGLIAGLVSSSNTTANTTLPVTVFNRVNNSLIVCNNGKMIQTTTSHFNWAYGISDDGCFSGTRSWRFTFQSMNIVNYHIYDIMFGIWNSNSSPSRPECFYETHAWVVYCFETTQLFRAGARTYLNSSSKIRAGDVILLVVDCDQRRLTVQNTTQGWTYTIDQLPPPNPAYYPLVILQGEGENESITIEAAS